MALCAEHEFPFLLSELSILHGWALVAQGREEKGITQLSQGLAAKRAMGAEGDNLLIFRAVLAEAYGNVGRNEEGLALLAEALELADWRRVHSFEAELYRLKGELTLQSRTSHRQATGKSKTSRGQVEGKSKPSQNKSEVRSPESEAEECFLKAIEIAQQQQAKSLELRATMSLARLWQEQGKHKQAHKMLTKIYGWFTEGFDTKDLQAAKTLLEELGSP